MKTTRLLSILFTCFIAGSLFAQTSGGPDTYGYTWKNSADAAPNKPNYVWNDIKATGTQITGLGDDNSIANIPINWNFRFYWTNYNKITVGSNGWIGFTGAPGNIAAPFPALPAVAAKNTISPLLADLTFTQTNSSLVPGASAWYWTNNTNLFIVQYDSVPYWVNTASGYAGRYTFQIILSGADSSITFQYKVAQAGTPAYTTSEGSATGICNSTGQIGLQVLPSLTFPTATTAVKFYYPNPVTYQVFDATPAWNQNSANGGFFVLQNSAVNLKTDIENAGNQPLSSITATGQLFDIGFTQVWTSSSAVSSLAAGADTVLTYPSAYTPTVSGTFLYRSTTSGSVPADINTANDITDVEMVAVTPQANMALSYVTAATPAAANSWGGNGGQGIYIEPPFYPATITSLDFMVTSSGTTGKHRVQIVDDDGPGNSPGTVLYLDSVVAATVPTPPVYLNVPVTSTITITSGGVYVAWFENGDTLSAIGTDAGLPLSNRNYEIIGGSWASFRNNSAEDLMIKVNIDGSCAMSFSVTTTDASCSTCSDGTATVNITGGSPPYTYSWNTSPVQNTQTATGLLPGTYTVCATDANGCSNCVSVTVIDNTAVTEIYSGASIVISPNPFNSSAQVKIDFVNPNHNELSFVVFDIYGREIQSIDLNDRKGATIDFTLNRGYNIPNGLYFYRLKDSEGILSAGKFIVQ